MKRLLIVILLFSSSAAARELTVTMSDEAWQVVINALDVQVKQQGLSAADNAVFIRNAIQAAAKKATEETRKEELPREGK